MTLGQIPDTLNISVFKIIFHQLWFFCGRWFSGAPYAAIPNVKISTHYINEALTSSVYSKFYRVLRIMYKAT